ncbi:hypothetical protein LCGC14_0908080 [marine sediment metagenome]|uniref:Uncharacterized protein n=1 Tax=marine sediment metagenome TaxID=412755 RepID=A0A0F9RDB5_9ZZZZ
MVAPLVVAAGIAYMLLSSTSPYQRFQSQQLNTLIPNEILDPASLIEARAFNLINDSRYKSEMKKHGFNATKAEKLEVITKTKLSPLDLIQLKRRGLISDEDFISQQQKSRTDDKTIDQIENLSKFIPGVQDTIQFAVREAYRDDIADKFGYDDDFPTTERVATIEEMNVSEHENLEGSDRLIAQALQIGLDPNILRRFWRAHWQLPSITAGLEMFHRLRPEFNPNNPVDFDTIKELLKIQDIAPFWQERILETSFNLPTRVDIRRMYVAGLLDREKVFDVYQQRGFNPEWAEKLTQLADSDKLDSGRDLSRSMIEKAYEEGIIKRENAVSLLIEMRYDENEAEIIVNLIDRDLANNKLRDKLKLLKAQFIRGIIDEALYKSSLDDLNILSERRDLIILASKSERLTKQKLATKEDLKSFFNKDLMNIKEVQTELIKAGYSKELADMLIASWS